MKILGLDPGTTNFGYAVLATKGTRFKPVDVGKVQNRMNRMENIQQQCVMFKEEMLGYITRHKPNVIIVERFMNRGRFSGATGEYVSMMIGILIDLAITHNIEMHIVNPATWKNAVSRALDKKKPKVKRLDRMYAYTLSEPHELDAYMMTHYMFSLKSDEVPFTHLKGKAGAKGFVHDFEAVSTGKKKRNRKII